MMKFARVISLLLLIMAVGVWSPSYAEVGSAKPANQSTALVNLVLQDVTVKQAIEKLFEGRNLRYMILPGVGGQVKELTLKGVTFDQALKALGDAAGFMYHIEDGVYAISPIKPFVMMPAQPKRTGQPEPAQVAAQPPAEYAGDMGPAPGASMNTGNSIIVEQAAPVFYGHPGPSDYAYGYGGGAPYYVGPYPPYNAGGNVVVGGLGGVVVVPGGYLRGASVVYPPPPPGWVSPEMLRFLRNQWALSPIRNYPPPYGY